jgi:hypothetical protein
MKSTNLWPIALGALLAGCSVAPRTTAPPAPGDNALAEFQQRAVRFHSIVTVPTFETTPEELNNTVKSTIAQAESALGRIGRLTASEAAFGNSVRALDDVTYDISTVEDRLDVIKQTSTNAALRDAWTTGRTFIGRSRLTPTPIPICRAKTPSCWPTPCATIAAPA